MRNTNTHIDGSEQLLKNILLVFNQKAFKNGNFSNFDFTGLDLTNVDLSEYNLSDKDCYAIFTDALIGVNTFRKNAHTKAVTCIAVSPDGTNVVSCGKDKVILWDFGRRSIKTVLYTYEIALGTYSNSNNQVIFDLTGKYAVFTDDTKVIEVEIDKGNRVDYSGATHPIIKLFLSQTESGETVYIGTDEKGTLYVWKKGNPFCRIIENKPNIVLFPLLQNDRLVKIDNETTRCTVSICNHELKPLLENIELDISLPASKTFNIVHSVAENNFALIAQGLCDIFIFSLDLSNYQKISLNNPVENVSISSNGLYLFVQENLESAFCFHIFHRNSKNEQFKKLSNNNKSKKEVDSAKLVMSNNILFYANNNGQIIVEQVSHDTKDKYYIYTSLDNHSSLVEDIALKKEGQCFIAYEDGIIREWNYLSGNKIREFRREHTAPIRAISVTRNADLLVSGGEDGKLLLWDIEEGTPNPEIKREIGDFSQLISTKEKQLDSTTHYIREIVISDDDKYIVASCNHGLIGVWQIDNTEKEPLMKGNAGQGVVKPILYFCANGKHRLVSGGFNGSIIFWNLDFDNKVMNPISELSFSDAHSDRVRSLALAPDKSKFVSYGEDNKIIEWSTDGVKLNEIEVDFSITEVDKDGNEEIQKNSSPYAESICYNGDSKINKLYYYSRAKNAKPIIEYDFEQNTQNCKYNNGDKTWGSATIVSSENGYIIFSTDDGYVFVLDSLGNIIQKMKPFSLPSESLRKNRSLQKAKFEPKELRKEFISESVINGKIEDWLRDETMPSIIGFMDVNPKKFINRAEIEKNIKAKKNHKTFLIRFLKKFGPLFRGIIRIVEEAIIKDIDSSVKEAESIVMCNLFGEQNSFSQTNDKYQKIRMLSQTFIACTVGNDGVSIDSEQNLFEACIAYLFLEAPKDEQNNLMIIELLIAEKIQDNQKESRVEEKLFNKLKEDHYALMCYREYKKCAGNDNKIRDSVLARLSPLFPVSKDTKVPYIEEGKIHKLALSLACNCTSDCYCPDILDSAFKFDVRFFELIFAYFNTLKESERTNEHFVEMLKMNRKKSLELIKSKIDIDEKEISELVQAETHIDELCEFIRGCW